MTRTSTAHNTTKVLPEMSTVQEFPFTSRHTVLAELSRRRKNAVLKERLNSRRDTTRPFPRGTKPFGVFFRQVGTPSHETLRFLRSIEKTTLVPLILEYHGDKFVSAGNSYKRSLGKMPIYQYTGADGRDMVKYRTIIDFNSASGKSLDSITCITGGGLIDFHHMLLARIAKVNPKKLCHDATEWFGVHGDRADLYYEAFLTCFLRDAVLFEHLEPTASEKKFVDAIMLPAFRAVEAQYGYAPLIVELVPRDEKSRSFWDYYPKKVERQMHVMHI